MRLMRLMRRVGFHLFSLITVVSGYDLMTSYSLPHPLHLLGLALFAFAFWARGGYFATQLLRVDAPDPPAWRRAARWLLARAELHAPAWVGCRPHCLRCCRCPDCDWDRARAVGLGIGIRTDFR